MISVIVPVGGGREERQHRLKHSLQCVRKSKYHDYEIVLVEQSIDGNFYYESFDHDIYVKIRHNEFNPGWCRNVGVRHAKGDLIVLMDMDIVFPTHLLNEVSDITDFIFGAHLISYNTYAESEELYNTGDLDSFLLKNGYALYSPKTYGAMGGLLCMPKWQFFDKFGGYVENFFRWGLEDKEFAERIASQYNTTPQNLPCLPIKAGHLCHDLERGLDGCGEGHEYIFKTIQTMGHKVIIENNKNICGKVEEPSYVCLAQ